jgi:hypothetical protein
VFHQLNGQDLVGRPLQVQNRVIVLKKTFSGVYLHRFTYICVCVRSGIVSECGEERLELMNSARVQADID